MAVADDPDPESKPRGRTVPLPEWWGDAVKRELAAEGIDQDALAAELGIEPSRVSRAITNAVPTLSIVIAISNRLHLPLPVVVPETEAEALAIDGARRLFRLKLATKRRAKPADR